MTREEGQMNLAPAKMFVVAVAALTLTGSTVFQGCSSTSYRPPQPPPIPNVSPSETEPPYPGIPDSSEVLRRAEKKRECYEDCQSEYDKAVAQCPRSGDLNLVDTDCAGELISLSTDCMTACEARYRSRQP